MRIGDDRYFDPAQVAVGYARAAAARGATLLPKTDGLAVNIRAGKVTGVTTAKGTILRSAAVEVKDQLPILQTAQVREVRGGIPTMTADGHHILGPAPGGRRLLLRKRLQRCRAFNLADGGRGTCKVDRRWQAAF